MKSFIKLYSNKNNEIKRFLEFFYSKSDYDNKLINKNIYNSNINKTNDMNEKTLEYKINFDNPINMSDIIGSFVDNREDYKINMWICIDQGILINVTENNADDIIRYLFERFPY